MTLAKKGVLRPDESLATVDRRELAPRFADLARQVWVPQWRLPDGVTFDQPVLQYLPSLQLYDPVMTREITVRDLLTHHTGLPGSDQLWTGNDYGIDEIIRRMRQRVGPDFIIIYRLSMLDLIEDGSTWEEVVQLAKEIEKAGATIINTGIGWHEARWAGCPALRRDQYRTPTSMRVIR